MRALSGIKRYVQRINMLSRNAKLYLVATIVQGLSFGIWGVIFNLYLNLPEVGFQSDFISNVFTASAIATGFIASSLYFIFFRKAEASSDNALKLLN